MKKQTTALQVNTGTSINHNQTVLKSSKSRA